MAPLTQTAVWKILARLRSSVPALAATAAAATPPPWPPRTRSLLSPSCSASAARRPRCPGGAPRPGLRAASGCGAAASKRKSSSWSSSPATNEGSVGDDDGVDGDENMPMNRSPAGDRRGVRYSSMAGAGRTLRPGGSGAQVATGGRGRIRMRTRSAGLVAYRLRPPSSGRERGRQATWWGKRRRWQGVVGFGFYGRRRGAARPTGVTGGGGGGERRRTGRGFALDRVFTRRCLCARTGRLAACG